MRRKEDREESTSLRIQEREQRDFTGATAMNRETLGKGGQRGSLNQDIITISTGFDKN